MRQWWSLIGVALLLGAIGAPSEARAQFALGVQGSFGEGATAGAVGVRAAFPVGPARWGLELSGSADLFFPRCERPDGERVDCSYFGLNLNTVYRHDRPGRGYIPYAGLGGHYRHIEWDLGEGFGEGEEFSRGAGINAVSGAEFLPGRRWRPFVEARYELMVNLSNQFVFTAGVLF